jgi:putative transposase
MSSYTRLTYHVVYATKYRRPAIGEASQDRLYEYIGGIIRAKQGHLIEVGGITDHIHILAHFPPTIAVSDMVRDIKASSAKWMNERSEVDARFEWQKGYGAFTVSTSLIPEVRVYIQNQSEHHRKASFEEEYVAILNRHGIPFERRYLFEGEHHG